MSSVASLMREDLRGFVGYKSARSEVPEGQIPDGTIWLNANESPWPGATDAQDRLRRYPQPQPLVLRAALAALYGCAPQQLLIGRGSDEAIDLLVRAFCTPGRDAVLVTPPVFGMYAVCAKLQGARLLEVPLDDTDDDFRIDLEAVARVALAQRAKLVFLCSPGNPAGAVLPADAVLALARRLEERAMVVVDEAYIEFADAPSLIPRVGAQANLAVLRTLSKAHALAAARIGCLVANPDVISALRRCQAPYPIPDPCAQHALDALAPAALERTGSAISEVQRQRDCMRKALDQTPGVRCVYPSQANFLLVRFVDADAVLRRLLDAGIVVRDMRAHPQLGDALRITIGSSDQNARVLATLQAMAEAA
jgi:histidinol-phosphate aminotransferase